MDKNRVFRRYARSIQLVLLCVTISGVLTSCGTAPGWLPASGPSREQVIKASENSSLPIQVVEVNEQIARLLHAQQKGLLFSETLESKIPMGYIVGPGDVLEISIWESPPAVLFGSGPSTSRSESAASNATATHASAFPEQMVSNDGTINVPFAGRVPVSGKSPQQIEEAIVERLTGKANLPQVLVRVIRNTTSTVTVVGEVAQSARMPLTARGERLLDALASSGGVRQAVGKISLQLTRGPQVHTMPLDSIIRDPRQNILLQPGDVVTALYQSSSFTVMGATGKNEEVNFEAQGINLAQALARSGGLQDARADARAVFIFRLEEKKAIQWKTPPKTTPEGKVPVIYQVNFRDPANFFVAQSFPVLDKDMLYVSNAPAAELQKFLNIIATSAYSVNSVITTTE